ncbi:RluA family pseudouridine synthase [Clostridium botulinum]|uniref:Pseudouridine synthase n=1 Tax=Clostridium botulinum TaxID=1491 RepID=A0A0L9Y700_CLOBO|nr:MULTISPECIES: RluA family pseudouridine synthase [Clostridium]EES48899.1 pseudouridine synthase, RluA family [Clostridium botulinum E1 str. 'BoNT E Beluga']KAI3349697.1 RluA family pseudouridine synthase [Clostridium botulinum]KOM87393.1 pseudouridylate synthase [Clostridium botulinum]KOR65456.1 pseudouridylate synthase [Clostridium botulinum]MBN1034426.1 RluA family pseudouridine synthase [Clostridium botulinum]
MSILQDKVSNVEGKIKIREYLKEKLDLSTRLIRSASKDQRIYVNNSAVRMNYMIKNGDVIKIDLNKNESQNINPEKIDLDIVYEDDDVLVINKQPFIIVHPTKNFQSGTLANGILYYFQETNQNCIVRLVSRLDMNTSGLIIIAKNQFSHSRLSKDMKEKLQKRYLAIVHGNLEEKEGTIDLPIYKPEGIEYGSRRVIDERGQRSITHYKVIESFEGGDLVECLLETGRTHQIRVHLSHLGHPIYGDELYGVGLEENLIKRQALHAYGLDFESPRSLKPLSLRADLPDDIKELLEKIK